MDYSEFDLYIADELVPFLNNCDDLLSVLKFISTIKEGVSVSRTKKLYSEEVYTMDIFNYPCRGLRCLRIVSYNTSVVFKGLDFNLEEQRHVSLFEEEQESGLVSRLYGVLRQLFQEKELS